MGPNAFWHCFSAEIFSPGAMLSFKKSYFAITVGRSFRHLAWSRVVLTNWKYPNQTFDNFISDFYFLSGSRTRVLKDPVCTSRDERKEERGKHY